MARGGHHRGVTKSAAPHRSLLGYLAWAATAVIAAVNVAHLVRHGTGWPAAAFGVALFALYGFLPRIQAASARRAERAQGTVTADDWGVRRIAGDVNESIAWEDLAWVRIYTTSDGPGAEDVFFALGDARGKGCLIPNGLATSSNLLVALQQRLPTLDNTEIVRAMASTGPAKFTIWTRPDGPVKTADGEGATS